jgi:hypothetical protein
MTAIPEVLLAIAFVWAVTALAIQARAALRSIPESHAPAAGAASRGVLYGFTGAMVPSRKESATRYPVSFAAGILLHLGVAASFLTVLLAVLSPPDELPFGRLVLAPAAGVGLAAGLSLLVKRVASADLREISLPDDYAASLALAVFLSGTLAFWLEVLPADALGILAAILLLYLPLGKLRHVVFFFLARADFSARLGFRGVFPPRGGGRAGRG